MSRALWTVERLKEAAAPFSTRQQFVKGHPTAYSAAAKRKLLDVVCAHMAAPSNLKVPDETIHEIAKQFQHSSDFRAAYPSYYQAAYSRGILPSVQAHMTEKGYKSTHAEHIEYFNNKWSDKFTLLSEYKSSKEKITVQCKSCSNEWETIPFRIRCRDCGYNKITEKEHDETVNAVHAGKILRVDEYVNRTTKIRYKCDQGHIWSAMPHNVMRGSNCPTCSNSNVSKPEKELAEYVSSLGFEVVTNTRSVIPPKELDIYVPEKKTAIEFNGAYWHSRHPANYHLEKTQECEKLGIRLIHVWEHERNNPVIKSIISNALGCNRYTYFGRDCSVIDLEWSATKKFLNENHIQGCGAPTPINKALTHDGKIIAVMTFAKPRFQPVTTEWELVRYAVAKETHIIGGANKLWSKRPIGSVVSYSDRRLFSGKLYERLGFAKEHVNQPSYFYVNSTGETLSRYQTQRKNLSKLLGPMFNAEMSEAENMNRAGWVKMYDCGSIRWVWRT